MEEKSPILKTLLVSTHKKNQVPLTKQICISSLEIWISPNLDEYNKISFMIDALRQ